MKQVLFILGLVFLFSCGRSSEETEAAQTIDSLENEIEELKRANDTLSDHVMKRAYVTRNYPPYFDSITNPEEHILENLQGKPSLIPKDAVLGGTMRFTAVDFINDDLLIASYEDGHVMGKAIYTYRVNRNGELEFERLTTIK
ncbi:hypothetical protein LZ575_07600 [Antarcticibacterium sp. 1MA-6-2]|uniref:hypothetical protein n=1 Tax=Antarcticibacterium sp. 1MA-6-2 TaxID=2908210 RepID=UPI001F3BB5D0|nr:hypothetical protein [Antarcticibacterium sp. 1MA-6-2]UJH92381.1 hypothetical protein LZ575_07600 [Antarcticibacterium sp. 1MA-6-2]